jgi:hypothetical protein
MSITFSSLDDQVISEALSQSCNNNLEQQGGRSNESKQPKENLKQGKYKWESLDSCWDRLNTSDEEFVVKDCIGDGNCQFRSIEEAIRGSDKKYTHRQLRRLVSDYIVKDSSFTDTDFKHVLDNYKIEKNNQEFVGEWNPFSVKTRKQLAKQVRKSGFHFEGDDFTLSLLSKALKIDFVVFSQLSCTLNELSTDNDSIVILLYLNSGSGSGHYQTIGIKHKDIKKVSCLFNRKKLPRILENLLNQEYFYQTQIDKYYKSCCSKEQSKFTLTGLYRYLDIAFRRKITQEDKAIISKIIKETLKNVKTKYHPPKMTRKHNSDYAHSIKSKSIKKSVKKSVKRSSKKSSKKSVKRSSKKPSKKSIKKPSKKSVKRSSKKSSKKSVKRSSKKPSKKSIKKPSKKSVKRSSKKSSKKSVKRSSKKPSKKSVKRSSKKPSKNSKRQRVERPGLKH